VERAAAWLELPVPRSQVAPAEDLLAFGLDSPRQRISARADDGQELTVEVGDEAPTGTMTYVRLEGRTDVLVMSKYGLAEVLGLLDPLPVPQPTATTTPPAPTPTRTPPSAGTETPAATSTP
jgi:hypothetical protein